MPDFDVFFLLNIKKRKRRSHGKRKNGNFRRKHKIILNFSELNILLKSGRHQVQENYLHFLFLLYVGWMKRPINSMIENMICMKQLSLLGAILDMLFVRH